jgi:hypothetical protein
VKILNPSARRFAVCSNDDALFVVSQRRQPVMIFWRKSTMKSDSVFSVAELRSEIERVVDQARSAGLRHYVIESALQDAARAVATRHAATAPIL